MTEIIYKQPDGAIKVVDVPNGHSVMEGAIRNDVDGILAECGGSCSCATCHVYVDEKWLALIPPASAIELEMLEMAEDRRPNSRLSCQIQITDELQGLSVEVAEQ
jgi:2Fe-2S ferredoxin